MRTAGKCCSYPARQCVQDFICNEVGNRWWVEALEWVRAADWNAAPREDWEVDGEKAGTAQVAEPLSFVTVDNAGHMVRLGLPRSSPPSGVTTFAMVGVFVRVGIPHGPTLASIYRGLPCAV